MRRHVSAGAAASAFWAVSAAMIIFAGPAAAKPEAVAVDLGYAPGSVVIVNSERKIYYVTGPNKAIRYGVAVGKASELWTGRTFVSEKKIDPKWIPVDGSDPVEGGAPDNPLGKRALYLDWSLLRIHGTPSRGSIGSAVSNGCVRMLNEDVIDLFERVHIGAPVFAINSRADAGAFKTAKVGDFVYVNPEARLDAKGEEIDAATERRLREQTGVRSRQAQLTAQQQQQRFYVPPPPSRVQIYAPPPRYFAPEYRSGLGRGTSYARSPFDSGR
jgi:L,D-transpeptidase catalytic domain